MRDKLIAATLLIIMVLNFFDVLTDIHLGVPQWHIFSEGLIVVISAACAIYLISDIRARTANINALKQELVHSKKELKNISQAMMDARHEYSGVIQTQFSQWTLTRSEQEVAMLLLKGLSFKEISALRNTKEKTVRQQASDIYSKADVEGRHEFAAWFLEDFMQQNHYQPKSTAIN
ncbi:MULTISPECIES: helix-turn-helix transcriptional regulator [unclassified Pseudoalteromonas]|jgi:DNA-binding NarL/FixJ family response regulator|uniref:helix-turn-helix transcriptional regulator n=1 Tax=unclassified Pseudoalteromonas TaxID=194690 RepID=UPI000490F6E8|nr:MULTISPECIES: helix-turn-helix transcriptional regulator [unclassified Pseudoalteromonas]SFT50859.1 transcriptional regulator, LuxR family [Pseudoalteromonas sp. DSM 26666]